MMNKITFSSVWLDMDGTLINWSKGNVRLALISISDPEYYETLEPISYRLYRDLVLLKSKGVSLHIISGIPDYFNCDHVPIIGYQEYYEKVCEAKDKTIKKFFPGVFDTIDYVTQSQSKAQLILEKYNLVDPVFIDDMDKYIDEWKELINDKAYKIDDKNSCAYYLDELVKML